MLEIDDNKVIKAIQCCLDGEKCDKCPLQLDCSPFDATALRYALRLIKKMRQEMGYLKRAINVLKDRGIKNEN